MNFHDPEGSPFLVLATAAGFEPGFRAGGPVRSLAAIVDSISDKVDLRLITRDRDIGSSSPYPHYSGRWISRGRSRIFYLNTRRLGHWMGLWRELSALKFDLLYVNSLWNPSFTVAPIVAARLGIIRVRTILIAPRGELTLGALSLKKSKKRLFLKWWGPFLSRMDVRWHASSNAEASQIRSVIPLARIEVNSNQVSLPDEPLQATEQREGRPRLIFVGRISPMKNLDLVLESLLKLTNPVDFDIYGPIEDREYWSKCESYVRQVPSLVQVKYRGELAPADVRRTFGAYDAFIFPTLGENFGHVIVESLSASCPVVCSDRTPWTSVLEGGGGAIVRNLTPADVAKELERIAAMTPSERLAAKQAAGIAYRSWRKRMGGLNILEQARVAEWSSRQ